MKQFIGVTKALSDPSRVKMEDQDFSRIRVGRIDVGILGLKQLVEQMPHDVDPRAVQAMAEVGRRSHGSLPARSR